MEKPVPEFAKRLYDLTESLHNCSALTACVLARVSTNDNIVEVNRYLEDHLVQYLDGAGTRVRKHTMHVGRYLVTVSHS